VNLKFVEPVNAVHSRRAAVDAQDHRIFLPLFPAERFDEKAVNVPSVGALVSDALNVLKLEFLPEWRVQMRQLFFVAAREVGDVKVIEVPEVIDRINELVRLIVDVHVAHRARAGSDRANLSGGRINAKQ